MMKVRTCPGCRYSPDDLGDLYDPHAKELACANCPALGLIHCGTTYPRDEYYNRKGNGPRFFKENSHVAHAR